MKGGKAGRGRLQRPLVQGPTKDAPRGSGRKKGDPKRDWGAQPKESDKPSVERPKAVRNRPTA